MKKAIKEKWLKALRSGEYKKTTGALRKVNKTNTNPRFCCLGVLCDLYRESKGGQWQVSSDRDNYLSKDPNGESGSLPDIVRNWAGIDDDHSKTEHLVTLNDELEYNFKRIADVIEKEF